AEIPSAARDFVLTTSGFIRSGRLNAMAAAFTFGREDLIPNLFRQLARDLNRDAQGQLSKFIWYLERHVEVDSEEHGPLALRMISDLCGDDDRLWSESGEAAELAIRARVVLWDGILAELC